MGSATPPDEPSDEQSRIDPLLRTPPRDAPRPSGPGLRPEPPRSATRRPGAGRAGRTHAARGARAVALTASVLATGAVGSALAYSDGAWSADGGTIDDGLGDDTLGDDGLIASTGTVAEGDPAATPSAAAVEAATEDTTASTVAPDTTTTTPSTTPTETTVGSSGYADGVYLGTSEYTEWGDVQVEVTISDGRIVDVAAVDYPQSRKSSTINNRAIPLLEADAIELQTADLDIVSGATYTSRTYADSLQAALDAAAIAASSEAAS